VAHVAEECGFRAVNFRQSLRALLFRPVRARIGDAGGDLTGDEIDESSVAHIQGTEWIESGDYHSGRLVLTLTGDGEEERSPR